MSCAHKRARIFHIHHRALYEAIGEPHSRFRETCPRSDRAIAVLDDAGCSLVELRLTLAGYRSEGEKVTHFTTVPGRPPSSADELSQRLTFGDGAATTVRYFSSTSCLIAVTDAERRTHVFAYLVVRSAPVDFRSFPRISHSELLQERFHVWTVAPAPPAAFHPA